MCGVFTDDYLIAYNFTHQKAQKSPIMHHGLIKIFFFCLWNPATKPFSQLLHVLLSHLIVLQTTLHCLALIHRLQLTCLKQRGEHMWDWLLGRLLPWSPWQRALADGFPGGLRAASAARPHILVCSITDATLWLLHVSNYLTRSLWPQGGAAWKIAN